MRVFSFYLIKLSFIISTQAFGAMAEFKIDASMHTETFKGTAKNAQGNVVYVETHKVSYDPSTNKVHFAESEYVSKDGTKLGTLKSDFRKSLNSPEHIFINHINQSTYGVRADNENTILFMTEKDTTEEKTRVLKPNFAGNSLAVGCQGLNYYIRYDINKALNVKSMPISLLIPGRLEYFRFNMNNHGVQEGVLNLELSAANFFVRLFAPRMKIKYDVKTRRLLRYEGVSNLLKEDGSTQDVIIEYEYPNS
jgi:hypothetical protein